MSTEPTFVSLATAWSFEPTVALVTLLVVILYARGLRRLRHRGRHGSDVRGRHIVSFTLGMAAVVVALMSPIDTLSDDLFAVHMVQHILLLMVAPPLLLLGKPIPVLLVGAPRDLVRAVTRMERRTAWLHGLTRRLTSPVGTWSLYVGAFLAWHAPALYQAALSDERIHVLEHACFLSTALLFWSVVIEPMPGPARLHHGFRLLYAWLPTFPTTALSALLSLTSTAWYPIYGQRPRLWGLSVVDDQHLGGAIMWFGGDMLYVAAAAVLFFAMMSADERQLSAELIADDALG